MSQETLADNQDYRVGALRNIAFVASSNVEMLDVCGPFDVFAFADRWMRMTSKIAQPVYQLDVIPASWTAPDVLGAPDRRGSCLPRVPSSD